MPFVAFRFILFFKYVCVHVSERAQRDQKRAGAGVMGSCVLSDLGVGN